MTQQDPNAATLVFNGPSFHVSGAQLIGDAGELSLYLTTTRHAFNANATQVRAVNEVVARVIVNPRVARNIATALNEYLAKHPDDGKA